MKQWFAVWTKPKQEARAVENLRRQAFDVFCPEVTERRKRGGSLQWSTGPMFARYVFIHVDSSVHSIAPIRSTSGCIDLIRVAGRPAKVPEEVINGLRGGPVELDPAKNWNPGDTLDGFTDHLRDSKQHSGAVARVIGCGC